MSADHTLPLEPRARELRLDGFSLTVVEGPNTGATLRAAASEISVGTAPANDLVLTDQTVSRHHFSISATTQGFLLRDLARPTGRGRARSGSGRASWRPGRGCA